MSVNLATAEGVALAAEAAETVDKTVFILGAGASAEFDLPVGAKLKLDIAQALDFDFDTSSRQQRGHPDIGDAFRLLAAKDGDQNNISAYLRAAQRVRAAMPQASSIDDFLDTAAGDDPRITAVGKVAIAHTIRTAESGSKLLVDPQTGQLDYTKLDATWLGPFFQILRDTCRPGDLAERLSKVAFVVFNYDRCIEQFLPLAISNFYGMPLDDAVVLVEKVEILHPYGCVGKLSWSYPHRTGFGNAPGAQGLVDLVSAIKTFTEGTDESHSDIIAVRRNMAIAKRVVFLGFAFHPLNVDLLLPRSGGRIPGHRRLFATASGISKADCQMIQNDLAGRFSSVDTIELRNDLLCANLFHQYRRSLGFA